MIRKWDKTRRDLIKKNQARLKFEKCSNSDTQKINIAEQLLNIYRNN